VITIDNEEPQAEKYMNGDLAREIRNGGSNDGIIAWEADQKIAAITAAIQQTEQRVRQEMQGESISAVADFLSETGQCNSQFDYMLCDGGDCDECWKKYLQQAEVV